MQPLGKILVLTGACILLVGVLLMVSDRIPFLGKLPGDINIKKENFELHVPITTSLILSGLLTVVLWVVSQWKGK
jgi:hypothetical protein